MVEHRLGSTCRDVRRLQERLRELELYRGPLEGAYGGGTEAAVRAFQEREELPANGVVDETTWERLFGIPPPVPWFTGLPLFERAFALCALFETGAGPPGCYASVAGDADGQGLSWGALQWSFGNGSLAPLLRRLLDEHADVMRFAFHGHLPELVELLDAAADEQLRFARSIQHPVRHYVCEPWRGRFAALGRMAAAQHVQRAEAKVLWKRAERLAEDLGLASERGVVLMMDAEVQSGGVPDLVRRRLAADFAALPAELPPEAAEVERLRLLADRFAAAAPPRWAHDVRQRKLAIAEGAGRVHGIRLDLEEQFGIGLERFCCREPGARDFALQRSTQ
ncbi:MAG TPA: peptidoglycan-binding domain-containing protein [Thermoanaerobaculia bacterium]|nr:peptidoglycan-binding domain-containing protein [Thermoanaerobaculia bacterium]